MVGVGGEKGLERSCLLGTGLARACLVGGGFVGGALLGGSLIEVEVAAWRLVVDGRLYRREPLVL